MTAPALARADSPERGASLVRATIDWWRVGLVVVGALALAAGIAVVDARPVGVVHDDAMYVILARALASGQGYRFLNLPGAPAATHFPPGYPAFLAAVSWVVPAFPASVVAFKALNALFLALVAFTIVCFGLAGLIGQHNDGPWGGLPEWLGSASWFGFLLGLLGVVVPDLVIEIAPEPVDLYGRFVSLAKGNGEFIYRRVVLFERDVSIRLL